MNNLPPKTPFDMIISSNKLDMFKLFIPFLPPSTQSSFALYIKFQELQDTVNFFKNSPNGLQKNDSSEDTPTGDFISKIKPYLPEENREMFDNISNMMNMMELMKTMSSMEEGNNSMDFLKNMLSPEQQSMFDMMNQMYEESDNEEGDFNNE